jgi:hypothetical protein
MECNDISDYQFEVYALHLEPRVVIADAIRPMMSFIFGFRPVSRSPGPGECSSPGFGPGGPIQWASARVEAGQFGFKVSRNTIQSFTGPFATYTKVPEPVVLQKLLAAAQTRGRFRATFTRDQSAYFVIQTVNPLPSN